MMAKRLEETVRRRLRRSQAVGGKDACAGGARQTVYTRKALLDEGGSLALPPSSGAAKILRAAGIDCAIGKQEQAGG